MRVAIVHDWFVTYAGSERVVEQMLALFPGADLFSLVDFLPPRQRRFLDGRPVTTSILQRLPFARRGYANYLPLMPLAIEQFDLSRYDLVLSSSHCVAKGVLTGPEQLHVSYVHTPMRYAWDSQHEYLRGAGLDRGAAGWLARALLHKLRTWDARSASGVDSLIANSRFVAARIRKAYRRESHIIHPPVETAAFSGRARRENFYLTAARVVPYKRVDLLVEAFARLKDRQLIVIGDGPGLARLRSCATSNVRFLGYQEHAVVRDYLERARAFLFASREDFGIVMAEAQAAGTPVLAYAGGGALEIVRPLDSPQPTGVLFAEQSAASVVEAIDKFELHESRILAADCRANAARFSVERFREQYHAHVLAQWEQFQRGVPNAEPLASESPAADSLDDSADHTAGRPKPVWPLRAA